MNKTTEALKLAEKTLRGIIRVYKFETGTPVTALAAIREALAEQEKQEPVAWPVDRTWFYSVLRYAEKNPDCFDEVAPDCVSLDSCDADTVIDALNAAPVSAKREWVDLTDDDLDLFWVFRDCHEAVLKGDIFAQFRSAARAVIAAFKEKNK